MGKNVSTSENETETQSFTNLVIDWTLAGTMFPVLSYLTIACSFYQFYSNQRGLRLSNWLCTAASFLLLTSMIPTTLELTLSNLDDDLCTWISDATIILVCGSLYCVYLSLWFRQDAVYKQVLSDDVWVKRARVASKVVITGLTFFSVLQAFGIFITKATYIPQELCVRSEATARFGVTFALGLTVFQVGLIVLHVLPLTKYFSHVTGIDDAYRRCARCAVVCFVVDVAKASLIANSQQAIVKYDLVTHITLTLVLYVFFTTNVIALIFSFPDYGKRFFPFKEISLRRSRKIECDGNPLDESFNPKPECRQKPQIVVTELQDNSTYTA